METIKRQIELQIKACEESRKELHIKMSRIMDSGVSECGLCKLFEELEFQRGKIAGLKLAIEIITE